MPQTSARIILESPQFKDGNPMPREYTADGRNVSPPLTWRNVPHGVMEQVLALQDLDEPPELIGRPVFLQWVVYNIPPDVRELAAGFPAVEMITAPPELYGAYQAYSMFDTPGYRGPQPPPGKTHRYRVTVYALDAKLNLNKGMGTDAVLNAMKGHIIGEGSMAFRYHRQVPEQ